MVARALLFLSALAPAAFAESSTAECITKTITLVPSGYTPLPSSTPTPTPTSSSTVIPSSTSTPVITSTPYSSATPSLSRVASSSTPLIKAASVYTSVYTSVSSSETASASVTPSAAISGAASMHFPSFIAAGAAAVAGLLMI
ncbi:unnamed protein product [Penicillium glandicola]